MTRSALPVALFALCLASATALAEPPKPDPFGKDNDPFAPAPGGKLDSKFARRARVDVSVTPTKAKWGETVTVKLTVTPNPQANSWTYPAFPKDSGQSAKNQIQLPKPGDLVFIGVAADPMIGWKLKPRDENEPNGPQDQYTSGPVTWDFKAVVSPVAKPGKVTVDLSDSSLQVCDPKNCYYATGHDLPTPTLEVVEGISDRANPTDLTEAVGALGRDYQAAREAIESLKAELKAARKQSAGAVPPAPGGEPNEAKFDGRKNAKETEEYRTNLTALAQRIYGAERTGPAGLGAFIATAALWGLISLVTPCVFPMIPITVSIFLKQAHGSLRERLKLAAVYSLTIIAVLGVSAFALLKFMALLSTHPATNILLAGVFIGLALSLFGMYELTLPNSLQKRLQAKQSQGGTIGTIFGALAFTVISFTCVAPFLGGFAGISAGSDGSGGLIAVPTAREVAGGLAFATAFAAPFFVLALVPGLLKALPRSGGWLDSVKVVMGFLELAAALKFLRTAELRLLPTPQYFTYDVVLGGWVAISAACGLYLLNVFRLPHDEERPNIGVPRLLFALAFLGLALYLAPALFKGADGKPQRPSGAVYAWVEAFLLPEDVPPQPGTKNEVWRTDLMDAVEASRASGRPIFLDFTGVTCTNCKLNERDVFPQASIREELQQFEKVKLYTDEVPAQSYHTDPGHDERVKEARANRDFQKAVFRDYALPLYAVLMPQADGRVKVVGVYDEGKINDPAKFATFLKGSLEQAKAKK